MVLQLAVADGVFVAYAQYGRGWDLPTSAIHSWLAATLVEVTGIVYVVVSHLFPRGPRDRD